MNTDIIKFCKNIIKWNRIISFSEIIKRKKGKLIIKFSFFSNFTDGDKLANIQFYF
jgi:hypothetical protein